MIVKNRRRVDFYTHVVATTPEDSSSRRRIWRYGERSFSSMRTASLRGFFTSGRRSRGRRSNLLKLPIVKTGSSLEQHKITTLMPTEESARYPLKKLKTTTADNASKFDRP